MPEHARGTKIRWRISTGIPPVNAPIDRIERKSGFHPDTLSYDGALASRSSLPDREALSAPPQALYRHGRRYATNTA
jgi:hypothetical protein